MNRLALFDCDGTLVDSQANICLAMEDCFTRSRLDPPDRAATRRIVGLSLLQAMQALLPDADDALHLQLAEDYKLAFQQLRRDSLVKEPLFDGITETLEELLDNGWLLGIATGKSDRGLALCLEGHDLFRHFITLQTADRHPSKPHPSMIETAMADAGATPETTAMIGDTSYDMLMARTARAHAVGVSWGYHEVDDLIAAGAGYVANRAVELPAHLKGLQ